MDLRLLDHLVIGRSEEDSEPYFSFREHGLL